MDLWVKVNFIVTGTSSGIGTALKKRYEDIPEQFSGKLVFDLKNWRLGDEIDSIYDGFGLIHLAHSREFTFEQNVGATEKLYKNIRPGSIFLSTVSAHSQSKSKYGKSKYQIEQIFLSRGAAVVKSGLICSKHPSAMLKTLNTIVNRLPIIPLPFKGTNLFYLTDQECLVSLIAQLTHNSDNLTYRAFSTQAITFKQLLMDLAKKKGIIRFFIDLPAPLSSILIGLFNRFLGRFSFSDSLISLVNAPNSHELLELTEYGVYFPPNPHLIKYN